MEENKKAKTIPQKRLEAFIERLKVFLDKFTREKQRILSRSFKTLIRAIETNETTKDKKR
ncbi:hypothetical protein [Bacillus toyonensis]|uniref:hypothetical protein n=1 Tax=Bacillus toyonensis TaxID=155322 RepID=UPI0020D2254E|nr:hypothetical protein [Bacillus toyonensis]